MGKINRRPEQEMMNAATQGDLGRLKAALALGADIDFLDLAGRSALARIGARNGFHEGMAECARHLIEAGASCGPMRNGGPGAGWHSALVGAFAMAAASGRKEIVLAMCESPRVAAARELDGSTALMMSIKMSRKECFNLLLAHGGASERNNDGETALMWAAGSGDMEMVKALLPISDLEAVDCRGLDAMDWAFHRLDSSRLAKQPTPQPLFRDRRMELGLAEPIFCFLAQAAFSQGERRELAKMTPETRKRATRAL